MSTKKRDHPAPLCMPILRSGLFLLLPVKREQRNARNLDHLESHTRNITNSMALPAKPSDKNLVVLVNEVEAAITRHKGSNLLAVFDELSTHALANSGVGLFSLNADLLKHNALAVR